MFNSLIDDAVNRFKGTLGTQKPNHELFQENYFSQDFLIKTLQNVGFEFVKIPMPAEKFLSKDSIVLNAKLYDEKGNSFVISVHHCGNVLTLSAFPNSREGFRNPENTNRISMTKVYLHKYIDSKKESETQDFGNQTQIYLLRKCKEKANSFFDELEDEFKRRHRFFAK